MASKHLLEALPSETTRSSFAVVALVTSAGGLEASSAILRTLPSDWPTAVLVAMHLSGQGSALVEILSRHSSLPIVWAEDGGALSPGCIQLCPPGKRLEVLPDGTCALSPVERVGRDKPLDFFLESLADSFGARVLAVVLTGMGNDGAVGARAVKQAGGVVLVQSEDTAERPSMPRAAIESGAADLVLPLSELGSVIVRVVGGGKLPRPCSEVEAAEALFAGGGELGALMREKDWSTTPLGPVLKWPRALKTAVRIALTSRHSMGVWWGKELIYLYNDAHKATLRDKHPQALGSPAASVWREVWDKLGPRAVTTLAGVTGTFDEAFFLLMERNGYLEETYYTFSYSPVPNDDDGPGGLLFANTEDTPRIISERQIALLREVAAHTVDARTVADACTLSAESLATNPHDVPFAVLYLLDPERRRMVMASAVNLEHGHPATPEVVGLDDASLWPFAEALRTNAPCLLRELSPTLGVLPTGAWDRPPKQAVVLPVASSGRMGRAGILIVGLSPYRLFDDSYRGFLELVAGQIAAALANAHAYEEERKRAEALAELDRAKTVFFSNISHEFRTPLTLLLAPLEEWLRRRDELPPTLASEIDVALRNARRLLNLVNTLLDFSRVEAGRLRAHFAPTDLAALTTDLASLFRSAVERAGLRLRIDCPPLPEPVWVDHEMWEKIVSNLLSNALKFTFEGEIDVTLRVLLKHVELVVRDTGVGIPQAEIPHLFKRFHRVQGMRARTYEGSGIGLALVHELVRQHYGRIRVQSKENEGATFTVWLPLGVRQTVETEPIPDMGRGAIAVAATMAEEAAHWNGADEETTSPPAVIQNPLELPPNVPLQMRAKGARVLVVDDNADMRVYLQRLLTAYWQVSTAKDGAEALTQMTSVCPDLILADVMMPNLDGFELVRRLRQDEAFKHIPIILVTARAGEEAAIEGLLAGAHDYLAKPFSARELVACVGAQLELARLRMDAARREQALRQAVEAAHAQLFNTLESITDGFYTLDREYRFTYVNQRAKDLWRGARPEVLGRRIWDEFPDAQELIFGEQISRAMEEQISVHFEGYYPPWQAWLEVYIYPSGEGIAVFFHDITDRKRAEAAVREDEACRCGQRLALEAALNGEPLQKSLGTLVHTATYSLSMGTQAAFYLANGEGTSLHHVVGMSEAYAEAINGFRIGPESLACGLATYTGQPVLTTDVTQETRWQPWLWLAERFGYRSCWSFPIYASSGQFVGSFAVYSPQPRAPTKRDLDLASLLSHTASIILSQYKEAEARTQAEQALREADARFRTMADAAPMLMWETDASGTTFINQQYCEFFGVDFETARQRGWMEYLHPDDAAGCVAAYQEAVARRAPFTYECRMRRADGEYCWLLSTGQPLRRDRFVGVAADITEKKRAQEAFRVSEERDRERVESID